MKKKRTRQGRQQLAVLPGQGRRFSFSRLKQAFVYYVLLLLALVIIVQLGYHWLGEQFLAWRLQVVTADLDVFEQKKQVGGLVTRHEEVINAPAFGVILELAEPGKRVSVGDDLVTMGVFSRSAAQNRQESGQEQVEENEPESHDFEEVITVTGDQAGLLSYYLDGWEKQSGPFYLSEEDYLENRREGSMTREKEQVEARQPILKIVDNWRWYFNIILPLHPGREVAGEHTVELEFSFAPGEPVKAELYESQINEDEREVRLSYLIQKQADGFEEVRWTEATLLYSRQRGIIVPSDAVFKKDHRTGVYLNKGGRVVFQPVTVVEQQGDKTMVDGLEPQSLVITRHEMVEEGRRLN